MADEEKLNVLNRTISNIEKMFGKGAIMRLGEKSTQSVDVISTGILPLDLALGVGGLPKGRVVELYGPEGSGKTTLALHFIASAQNQGGIAAFIDAEHALDPMYAKAVGVDIDNLLLSQPDSGEQALSILEMLVSSSAVDITVVDSVAALVPQDELKGSIGDITVASQARLMSQALRRLTALIGRTKSIVVFINQVRSDINATGYGRITREITPGGRALKFFASLRLDVRRIAGIKGDDREIGHRVKVKVVKNKVAPPFRLAEFDIIYGKGALRERILLDMATEMNIIKRSGSWYSFEGEAIGQGKDNAAAYIAEHPELLQTIEQKIKEASGMVMYNYGAVETEEE